MVVVRVKRKKDRSKYFKLALAKPCKGCYKCIVEFGLRKVFYTTEEGLIQL